MFQEPLSSEQRFKQIQKYIDRMPSLSTTVTKVLEICNKPNTSPNDLNRVISLDPVLTGQVLRLINSAYYSLPNQITSLTRAIIMLGLNTVKNLALSTAILENIGQDAFQSLPMDQFWAHSICVGVTSKAIANRKGVRKQQLEEYFVAGLLHDLGKIPLNNRFSEDYTQALQLARQEEGPLNLAEIVVLGFDHGKAGKIIAEKWQLTDDISDSICYHHDPEGASEKNRELVAIVALANIFANVYEFGSAGDFFQEVSAIERILEIADLKWQDLSELQEVVNIEIEKAQVFLKVAEK